MSERSDPLVSIRNLVEQKRYRIRIHAVQHMIKEGFTEQDILNVLKSGRLLENYSEELRCLILGFLPESGSVRRALHVLCDHSSADVIDIVTAYVPQKPWWQTETRRGQIH